MPRDHAAVRRRQQPELLARLAAGATIKDVCRAPDMPCAKSVENWARRDALFAVDLAQARRVGEHRRRAVAHPERGSALLDALRQGQPLGRLLGRPGMPNREEFRRWRLADQVFGPEVRRLLDVFDAERRHARWAAHRAVWERPLDEALADQIMLRVLRGEPISRICADLRLSRPRAFDPWRRANPDWNRAFRGAIRIGHRRRSRDRSLCTPQLTRIIEDRIVHGASLRSLSKQPDMPGAHALYAWVRDCPEFADAVAQACDFRDQILMEQVGALAEQATPDSLRAVKASIVRLNRRLGRHPGRKRRDRDAEDV